MILTKVFPKLPISPNSPTNQKKKSKIITHGMQIGAYLHRQISSQSLYVRAWTLFKINTRLQSSTSYVGNSILTQEFLC